MDFHLATRALFATKDAPWRIKVTVAFMSHETRCEITLGFDHARPTTKLARTGWHIVTHLVAIADQWQMHAKIFKWVIAGITHQFFDSIRTIRRRAPAHRRLIDLKENPIVTVRAHTRIGRKAKRCRVTSGTAVWQNRRKRFDHQIGHALDLAEPRLSRCGPDRIKDTSFGRSHADRAERPLVGRDVVGGGIGIQQHRTKHKESGNHG